MYSKLKVTIMLVVVDYHEQIPKYELWFCHYQFALDYHGGTRF